MHGLNLLLRRLWISDIMRSKMRNMGGITVKIGIRKPSIKKSVKAMTTGKAKRAVKKAVNPLYGKNGGGMIKDPEKALNNKVYKKTTVGVKDLLK